MSSCVVRTALARTQYIASTTGFYWVIISYYFGWSKDCHERPFWQGRRGFIYVFSKYPYRDIGTRAWCNTNQMVVVARVRDCLLHDNIILVLYNIRLAPSARGHLGWFSHLERADPGSPVFVGGDFKTPYLK